MRTTPVTKVVLSVGIAVGLLAYVAIVDVGISAGRIHHGVHVGHVDVGGLTEAEAEARLAAEGEPLAAAPIVFSVEGFDCRFVPSELGWGPQPFDSARDAMSVGRGPLLDAAVERVRGWFGGVRIGWAGTPIAARVGRFLNQCEDLARAAGLVLDRPRLRFLIRRTIERWPRAQVFPLPLISG